MYPEKISETELKKVFKDYRNRSSFIFNYPHFGNDDNNEYYKDFIDANFFSGRKHKLQEHAIELSLAANIFHITHLNVIGKIIHSRRPERIKLLCLDWLNYFMDDIQPYLYYELNMVTKKSDDEFLKSQSLLNLLIIKTDEELFNDAIEILKKSTNPTLYYRYLNHLSDNNTLKILYPTISKEYHDLIKHSTILSDSQRIELTHKLSDQ